MDSVGINVAFLTSGMQFRHDAVARANAMQEETDDYHSSAMRLASFYEQTLKATQEALAAGFKPEPAIRAVPGDLRNALNVDYLQAGAGMQMSDSDDVPNSDGKDDDEGYQSNAQRLASFYDQTLKATQDALAAGHKPESAVRAVPGDVRSALNVDFLRSGAALVQQQQQNQTRMVTSDDTVPDDSSYQTSSQRLAAFYEQSAAATQSAIESGFKGQAQVQSVPSDVRNSLNINYLQSGMQFNDFVPSSPPSQGRSEAQRLAEFYNRTLAATAKAAELGLLPASPPRM